MKTMKPENKIFIIFGVLFVGQIFLFVYFSFMFNDLSQELVKTQVALQETAKALNEALLKNAALQEHATNLSVNAAFSDMIKRLGPYLTAFIGASFCLIEFLIVYFGGDDSKDSDSSSDSDSGD